MVFKSSFSFPHLITQVGRALSLNNLGFVSLSQKRGKKNRGARDAVQRFKNDPTVKVRWAVMCLIGTCVFGTLQMMSLLLHTHLLTLLMCVSSLAHVQATSKPTHTTHDQFLLCTQVFLLSLQHGSAGLTLVRANHVFMIGRFKTTQVCCLVLSPDCIPK